MLGGVRRRGLRCSLCRHKIGISAPQLYVDAPSKSKSFRTRRDKRSWLKPCASPKQAEGKEIPHRPTRRQASRGSSDSRGGQPLSVEEPRRHGRDCGPPHRRRVCASSPDACVRSGAHFLRAPLWNATLSSRCVRAFFAGATPPPPFFFCRAPCSMQPPRLLILPWRSLPPFRQSTSFSKGRRP